MDDNLSFKRILRIRYSFPRIQWLFATISIVSLLYLSSEEIWKISDTLPYPEISISGLAYYLVFFIVVLLTLHIYDTSRLVNKKKLIIVVSVTSILVDVFLFCLSEYIVLNAIQVLPQNTLEIIILLLVGALPSSLGAVVLTTLTAETLKEGAKKLYQEAKALRKDIAELEKERKLAVTRFESFEKRRQEFEEFLKKRKKS